MAIADNTLNILELAQTHGVKVTECHNKHACNVITREAQGKHVQLMQTVYTVEGYFGQHNIATVERLIVNQGGYLR